MLSFFSRLFGRNPGKDDDAPDPAQVAAQVLDALRRQSPGTTFTLDAPRMQIRRGGGGMLNLQNLLLDHAQAAPADRAQLIERFVLGMADHNHAPEGFDTARPLLLPVLRHLGGMDLVRIDNDALSKPFEATMVWQPLSPLLGVAVAIDREHAIVQVSASDLEGWGISFDAALAIATDNLRHKAAPAFVEIGPGLYASNYGDYYDAARIVLQELAWQLPLQGAPVAMVPNRTVLLLCGADDPAALAAMVDQARTVLREQSRPLSSEMFRLDAATRRWTPWTPPGEAGARLATLQHEDRANDYAEQKAALERMHEAAGADIFMASHSLVKRPHDGALRSYAVLSNGVDTWLPEADLVILLEAPEAEHLLVPWPVFAREAQHLLEPLPLVLPRWKVRAFPQGDCLQRLRAQATTMDAS